MENKVNLENDFWKNKISELQKDNMSSLNNTRLSLDQVRNAIEELKKKYTSINFDFTDSGSSLSLEFFVSANVKFRLFFQNQIKASFVQKNASELTKIADAKFIYSPFPQIEKLILQKESIVNELAELNKTVRSSEKKQKISGEFLKAFLMKNYPEVKFKWNIEVLPEGFNVCILQGEKSKSFTVSAENFYDILKP